MAAETTAPAPKVTPEKKKKPLVQAILHQIIEYNGWELIFTIMFVAFVLWGIYVLSIVYEFHTSEKYASEPKFSIYDFKLSFLFAALFFLYRKVCEWVFTSTVKNYLDHEKFPTEEDRNERAKKACKWIMCIIYYTCSTAVCYYLFKDQFFFPVMLGGNSQCSDVFKYMPGAPNIPYGQIFYMVQFGSHLHTLIDHILFKRNDSKFWEMFLHHSVAVFLIFFSYMSGEIAVGILVLFTHDPGDIFLDAVRFYNDLRIRKDVGIFILYVSFMGVWCYFRLYSFPVCLIYGAASSVYWGPGGRHLLGQAFWYLITMLVALVLLHLYWFIIIVKIALNIAMKKKEYNSYDNKKKAVKKEGEKEK